jgi:hypothetical protein
MILVDFRGRKEPKYLYVQSRAELRDCIAWLTSQLGKLEAKNKDWDSLLDLAEFRELPK